MKSWLMMNKIAQFLTLQRLPQELPVRDSFPPSRIVVCSKLLFVSVACREGISTLRVGVILCFSDILRRCHHPTNFGLKAFFFLKNEEISTKFLWDLSNRLSQKNKSIDKYFLGRLQNKDLCFANIKTKALSFFLTKFKFIWDFVFCWDTCFHRMIVKAFLKQS